MTKDMNTNVELPTEVTWPQVFVGYDKDGNAVEVERIDDGKVQDTKYSEDTDGNVN